MSNLYMTTTEFAALIVSSLDEQTYFKKDIEYHPADIYSAFVSSGETISKTMEWAINKEKTNKLKQALVQTTNLSKNIDSESGFITYTSNTSTISDEGYNDFQGTLKSENS